MYGMVAGTYGAGAAVDYAYRCELAAGNEHPSDPDDFAQFMLGVVSGPACCVGALPCPRMLFPLGQLARCPKACPLPLPPH
jgi:hypothetical protein